MQGLGGFYAAWERFLQLAAVLVLVLAGAAALAPLASADDAPRLTGSWTLELSERDPGMAHLNLQYRETRGDGEWGGFSNWGRTVPLESLRGLTREQLDSQGQHVAFQRAADAGTFEFEGWAGRREASGHYRLVLNPQFNAEMKRRGLGEVTPRQQSQLAFGDFQFALVDELNAQGYQPYDAGDLVRMVNHGVTLEYLRGMKAAGYQFKDVRVLTKMRDHGVTPQYIRELAEVGYRDLSAEQLLRARDHGVTAPYVREIATLGPARRSLEEVIRLRDHGVSAEYVASLKQAGYSNVSVEDAVRVRDHGVTEDFIAEMRQAGYQLPLEDLVRLRDHGVSASFIRDVKSVFPNAALEDMVRLKDHGVRIAFISDVRSQFPQAQIDDLVRLVDHGVSADFVRRYKDGRSLDEIIRMKDRGIELE